MRAMLNRFLRFVALAFMLQMTWGVASAYCLHESDKSSQHFGHHQHEHDDADTLDGDRDSAPAKQGAPHLDCAMCAHSAMHGSAPTLVLIAPLSTVHQLHAQLQGQSNPYLGAPERPKWNIAA